MTELEYKLMSVIASSVDMITDFSEDLDEFATLVNDEEDYNRANELADDFIPINNLLVDTFNEVKEENREEWDNLQKAECRIIEQQLRYQDGKEL